jgi:hypothetical protein
LVFVDSTGKVVGPYYYGAPAFVLSGFIVSFQNGLDNTGFPNVNDSSGFFFVHLAGDCSDARLLVAPGYSSNPLQLLSTGNHVLYYPSGPVTNVTIGSYETFNSGQDVASPGTCTPYTAATGVVSVATSDLSNLGFSFPLSLAIR